MTDNPSKLTLEGGRIPVTADAATDLLASIFRGVGCTSDVSDTVAAHLADASLCGVESHGLMRVLQYVEQFETGYLSPTAEARITTSETGTHAVDGGGGIGIPAMDLAIDHLCETAQASGMAALAVHSAGHTGRLGAFAERAADRGFLTITMGGGNRRRTPQVAPYGGRKGVLPTNPYCIGMPGGARGSVVLDFATGKIAGGWIYAAESAGGLLPDGAVIDRDGNPTRDPKAYWDGGAILPAGGAKGYALAVIAELVAEAMIGPATTECNWFMIGVDTRRYRDPSRLSELAEDILADLRACPPAPGFERVEVPGERERSARRAADGIIHIPERTWTQIRELAQRVTAGAAA